MTLFSSIKKITFTSFTAWPFESKAWPTSAVSQIPQWYKDLPKYANKSDKPVKSQGKPTVKTCAPFRDAMAVGYMLLTPAELEVGRDVNGEPDIWWNRNLKKPVVEKRGPSNDVNSQVYKVPTPEGFDEILWAWTPTWAAKSPQNYSLLFTHPLNRPDLPFYTTSGLIDSDIFNLAGNMPFYLKKSFIGIIPKGTPFAQVIPIKREPWESEVLANDDKYNDRVVMLRDTIIEGFYAKFMRQKKSYK